MAECEKPKNKTMGKITRILGRISRIFFYVEPFVCLTATVLQTVGFSTNAWAIHKNNSNNRLTAFGLWSTTICYELDCITRSHYDEYKDNIAKGFSHREVMYSLQLGHEVTATLALIFAALCFILAIIYNFCKCGKRQLEIGMVVTSLISGVLLLSAVGYFYGDLSATMRVQQNKLQNTFFYPWGLAVSASGAFIILVNGLLVTMFTCLRKTIPRRRRTESYLIVTTKENIPNSEPLQCVDDYDPPDYNDVEDDEKSDQSMV